MVAPSLDENVGMPTGPVSRSASFIHYYIFINRNLQLHEYNKCTTTQLDSQDQGSTAPSGVGEKL